MSVASWSGSLLEWENELAALKGRLAPVFGRAELRASASSFIDGLLSGISRKTGWQLAEQAGQEQPLNRSGFAGGSEP
jgi:SRSO17 transposase